MQKYDESSFIKKHIMRRDLIALAQNIQYSTECILMVKTKMNVIYCDVLENRKN
jgi:hypothetical protein